MAESDVILVLYVIKVGKLYFSTNKGRAQYVKDLSKAKLFTKVTHAKSRVAFLNRHYPDMIDKPRIMEINMKYNRMIL